MAGKPTHVVDASALIAYFKAEEGNERFADLLGDEQNVLVIHAVNLCEVYYGYLRGDGVARAEDAWRRATDIIGVVETCQAQFMKRVGRWKADCNLPLADAFAAATAEENACPLVTTDRNDFGAIDDAGTLQILWLR